MAKDRDVPVPVDGESIIDSFQNNDIRKVMNGGEWWFSVNDVIEALTETTDGTRYVAGLRSRDSGLSEIYQDITRPIAFQTANGPRNLTCTNIEGLFRLLQSVPSPKMDRFKKWLAKVGFERLQEIDNPDLAVQRAIALYRAKGYDDGWIDARIRNRVSRDVLTAEWQSRGVQDVEYAILTDAISIETFGVKTSAHKAIKNLKGQSLRDNMTPIELTLTTLGEQTTTEIARATDARGFVQNHRAAVDAGRIAGTARRQIEEATGNAVVSADNYLTDQQRLNNARKSQNLDELMRRLLVIPPKTTPS